MSTSQVWFLQVHTGTQYLATEYARASTDVRDTDTDAPQLVPANFCTKLTLIFILAATFFRWSWKVNTLPSSTLREDGVGSYCTVLPHKVTLRVRLAFLLWMECSNCCFEKVWLESPFPKIFLYSIQVLVQCGLSLIEDSCLLCQPKVFCIYKSALLCWRHIPCVYIKEHWCEYWALWQSIAEEPGQVDSVTWWTQSPPIDQQCPYQV